MRGLILLVFVGYDEPGYLTLKPLELLVIIDVPTVYGDLVLLDRQKLDPLKLLEDILRHRLVCAGLLKPGEQAQDFLLWEAASATEEVARVHLSCVQDGVVHLAFVIVQPVYSLHNVIQIDLFQG